MIPIPLPAWASTASAQREEAVLAMSLVAGTLPETCALERQVSFALGRLAVRRAIFAMGRPLEPVPIGGDGCPCWPDALVGTISHTGDVAIAAVAESDRSRGLGLDIERLERASCDHDDEVVRLVSDPVERAWIDGDSVRLIRLFSAKEAIFKAFYPSHRALFGFDAVHLEPTVAGFVATLKIALGNWPTGYRFPVRSTMTDHHVISATWLPPGG